MQELKALMHALTNMGPVLAGRFVREYFPVLRDALMLMMSNMSDSQLNTATKEQIEVRELTLCQPPHHHSHTQHTRAAALPSLRVLRVRCGVS